MGNFSCASLQAVVVAKVEDVADLTIKSCLFTSRLLVVIYKSRYYNIYCLDHTAYFLKLTCMWYFL